MGAWGTGSFENDDALDFVVTLEREGLAAIDAALERVAGLGVRDYLEAPDASFAIAAGEILAAARDGDVSRLPEAAQNWLDGRADGLASPALLALARRSVERVLQQSELKDLWEEGDADGQSEAWSNGVRALVTRLAPIAPTGKTPAPKRQKVKASKFEPGSILRVDLDGRWHTYARILAPTPKIAIHDCRVSAPEQDLLAIVKTPVLFILVVGGHSDSGDWPKVGHVPLEMAPVAIPEQFMQDLVTGACRIVDESFNARPAKPEECVALERVAAWDPVNVVERIRDHYAGRPNKHMDYMKVQLPSGK
jgi:Domain of unknown function (DUF4259)/Immunity protein 26